MTSKVVVLTVYDRPDYLEHVLESWSAVRDKRNWKFIISQDIHGAPKNARSVRKLVDEFRQREDGQWRSLGYLNGFGSESDSVLNHPYNVMNALFLSNVNSFVVRAEDDLMVSTDILEYFSYLSDVHQTDRDIATIHGFRQYRNPDQYVPPTEESEYYLYSQPEGYNSETKESGYNPLVWGTWSDRWFNYIEKTWDHDYSTYDLYPMTHSGWDWNLRERVLPAFSKKVILPLLSKVENIGEVGTHSTRSNHEPSFGFRANVDVVSEYKPFDLFQS